MEPKLRLKVIDENSKLTQDALHGVMRSAANAKTAPTGYMVGYRPISRFNYYSGQEDSSPISQLAWEQLIFDIDNARISPDTVSILDSVFSRCQRYHRENKVPIAIISQNYNHFSETLTKELDRGLETANFSHIDVEKNHARYFDSEHVFALSAILNKKYDPFLRETPMYHGERPVFVLDKSLMFGDDKQVSNEINIDFDDGRGLNKFQFGDSIPILYKHSGSKQIRVQIQIEHKVMWGIFKFEVTIASEPPPPDEVWSLASFIDPEQVNNTGKAYVFHAREGNPLDNIIIVSDAFPGHTWQQVYQNLTPENLLQTLNRNNAIAIIIYDTPVRSLQGNAYVFTTAILTANLHKTSDSLLTIVGPSMGGLISRYAISYLVYAKMNHQVGTYLSFDSPHKGAFIPPALQVAVGLFASRSAVAADNYELLRSDAALQMLVYQTGPYNNLDEEEVCLITETFREFYRDLESFPWLGDAGIVTYGISDGAGNGKGNGIYPGEPLLTWSGVLLLCVIESMAASQSWQSTANLQLLDTPSDVQTIWGLAYYGAPGGTRDTLDNLYQGLKEVGNGSGYITPHSDHCFVPSVSALNCNFSLYEKLDNKPADEFVWSEHYIGTENVSHVSITPNIANWIKTKLLAP